jgi:YesN/AraC family two-component response regulator
VSEGNSPDFIIMDMNMPEMNGMEAARLIKELKPEIKIFILSG